MSGNKSTMFKISSGVCLLPIILSTIVYSQLPQQIAIHWDSSGAPDNFVHKAFAAYGLAVILCAINALLWFKINNDPKQANVPPIIQIVYRWIVPVISLISVPVTLFIALGRDIPINILGSSILGVLLIIKGNYLPKNRQNYTIGIKVPWTLNDDENWSKTHHLAGYLFIIGGIIVIAAAFLTSDDFLMGFSLTIFITVLLVLIPVVYSYSLYKNESKKQQ